MDSILGLAPSKALEGQLADMIAGCKNDPNAPPFNPMTESVPIGAAHQDTILIPKRDTMSQNKPPG